MELRRASSGSTGTRLRILVADDDRRLRELLRMLLSDEYEIDTVGSGEDALALLADHPYDAILCDLSMHRDGAPEVHATLRRRDPSMAERLIVISGGAYTTAAQTFLAENACPRVAKPFSPADVRRAVADVVRRHGLARRAS